MLELSIAVYLAMLMYELTSIAASIIVSTLRARKNKAFGEERMAEFENLVKSLTVPTEGPGLD